MPLSTFAGLAWGTADDLNAGYTTVAGAVTVTSGITDPFGGTSAYTLNDTDGVSQSGRGKAGLVLTGSTAVVGVCWKAGTSAGYIVILRDTTASAVRIQDNGTQSGGVPTQAGVVGTAIGAIPMGNGWYLLLYTGAITSGNTHRLEVYPTPNVGSATGTSSFYVRNIVALDVIDFAKSFKRPKPGYRATVAPSGVREVWSYGNDPVFKGTARWLPAAARSNAASVLVPQVVSGWYGENEATGINCGLLAALAAGWDMQVMTFAPDISACATNYSGYLTQPGENFEPDLESSGDYQVPLEFVGTGNIIPGI